MTIYRGTATGYELHNFAIRIQRLASATVALHLSA